MGWRSLTLEAIWKTVPSSAHKVPYSPSDLNWGQICSAPNGLDAFVRWNRGWISPVKPESSDWYPSLIQSSCKRLWYWLLVWESIARGAGRIVGLERVETKNVVARRTKAFQCVLLSAQESTFVSGKKCKTKGFFDLVMCEAARLILTGRASREESFRHNTPGRLIGSSGIATTLGVCPANGVNIYGQAPKILPLVRPNALLQR